MNTPSDRDHLLSLAQTLGDDECKVLAYIGARLAMGQEQYGKLDIAGDKRDWERELTEELGDSPVYMALAVLKAQLRRETGT